MEKERTMEAMALYHILVSQLDEVPNLTEVQKPAPCPEAWPLVLKEIRYERKRTTGFIVCDLNGNQCLCTSTVSDIYDKVAQLEPGAIIHLKGAQPRFHTSTNAYCLDVDMVLTLKEYDNDYQREAKRKKKREARIMAEMASEGLMSTEASTP
jgi:hypothetical protein